MSGRKTVVRDRRVRVTLALIMLFLIGILALILIVLFTKTDRKMEMPLLWSNSRMVYISADQTAMQSDDALSLDICVGGDNVAYEDISLIGNERGALFSLDDRKVLFSKDMHQKIYPASITKLLTAILALKSDKLDENVVINWKDLELESGSQVVGFRIGDRVSMKALMRGLLIHSGNDAAQAIARVVGGTQENFIKMMNEELDALGCTGSHFTNPTGLHDENHYTTVYDIYLMLNEAMKYDEFVNIIQIPVYDLQYWNSEGKEMHVTLDSTDKYLTGEVEPPKDVSVLGGKTGTTSAAGSCLSVIAQNAYGQFYIAVVVRAASKDDLYTDINQLLSHINS
ncbi:MAG: D-alanyl-D-alanine carboxypeptidase [Lachnospiraceae bacterium]|nr:D-alanyl-D-alanine carboxypeptidase [Lachnospiraceae bacterium]